MAVSRRVVPGEWYAVLGDEVVVLLPPTAKSRVAGVWELVDDGAGFDVVLDGLISGGLRELPGFVLLSKTGGDVRVVIRGAGAADLVAAEGPVTVSGDADSTWVERAVSGVSDWRLRVAGVEAGAEGERSAYPLGTGLVRASSVEQTTRLPMREPRPPDRAYDEPAAHASRPVPIVEPTPQPVPVPEPAATLPVDSDPTPSVSVPPVAPTAVARLVFSSGDVVDVDQPILVGRAPQARGVGDEGALLVSVLSPNQEISATHVEIRPGTGPDEGSAVVTDLGSTNGTLVVQPGQRPEDLQPGIAIALALGAVIDLGEGATIQVTA